MCAYIYKYKNNTKILNNTNVYLYYKCYDRDAYTYKSYNKLYKINT